MTKKIETQRIGFERIRGIRRLTCLRRTKDMTINCKKIIEIPDKFVRKLDFNPSERAIRNRVSETYSSKFNDIVSHGEDKTILKNYSQVLPQLVRLRHSHPYLVQEELERKKKRIKLCKLCKEWWW